MTESQILDLKSNNRRFERAFDTMGRAGKESAFFDIALVSADKLRDGGFRDSLTGLLNRDGFKYELQEWKEAQPTDDGEIAIACIDLNNFKGVNDEHGHNNGDLALTDIASILQVSLRSVDIIARWGGDEIVLGLPLRRPPEKTSHEEVFAALDNKLNGALKEAQRAMAVRGEPVKYLEKLSFAIGVEVFKVSDLDKALADLLENPDKRMYEHKRELKGNEAE